MKKLENISRIYVKNQKKNILDSGLCIFHDENYLKDLINNKVNQRNLISELSEKLTESGPLIWIGYHLPYFSFTNFHFEKSVDFSEAKFAEGADFFRAKFAEGADFYKAQFAEYANFSAAQFTEEAIFYNTQFTKEATFYETRFTKEANFSEAQFAEYANFSAANFTKEATFSEAKFTKSADFSEAKFAERADFSKTYVKNDAAFTKALFKEVVFYKTQFADKADFSEIQSTLEKTYPRLDFHNVQFDVPEHIAFLKDNLSEVSFVGTDITRVKFGEDTIWGDKFKIREEREIENQLKTTNIATDIQLGDVLAVYRNLRENYEFRMRYDEAGEFFIREMGMKRRYQTLNSRSKKNIFRLKWWIKEISLLEEKNIIGVGQNDWVSRNISLTGLYYHLSRYGQSFSRPALFGVGIVAFSTLLWLTQQDPAGDFLLRDMTIPQIETINKTSGQTNFEIAFIRSLTNFLPSLSFGTDTVGLLDVAFKIVGGAV